MTYRPEIDGLRAIAVIPVVLYHLTPRLVPGGFIGVDVFFVISGFLITSIILRETGNGTFTLRSFWMRRIRRLFPALATVLLATICAGSLILYPVEWRALGSQLSAVLLLSANFHLQKTGGYWDPAAEEVPLLHTWSLAVEEQFYLLFPLLVLIMLRLGKRSLLPILGLGALASLVHGIVTTNSDPSAAFYLLPTRAWELLAGCLLATWNWKNPSPRPLARWTGPLCLLGLLAVIASCFLISRGAGFPGSKALLPTLGTVAVIAFSNRERGLAKTILSAPPLVFVGKISYSLYLWHWPVIVFWKLQTMESVSALQHALPILLLSFSAAILSYFFVEKPFRRRPFPVISPKFAMIAATFLALFSLSFAIRGDHLRPFANPAFEPGGFSSHPFGASQDEAWRTGGIMVGEGAPEIVVIGSSHALMYASTVASIAREDNRTVSFLCLGNAFGRFHTEGDDAIFRDGMAAQRDEFDQARRNNIAAWKPRQVLWFGRWDNQSEILGAAEFDRVIRNSLTILLEHAERVALFTQPPFSMERRGSIVRYATTLRRKGQPITGRESPDRTSLRDRANAALQAISRDFPRVDIINLDDPFELESGQTRILSGDGNLLYHDFDHLSDHGAALVRPRIAEALHRRQ